MCCCGGGDLVTALAIALAEDLPAKDPRVDRAGGDAWQNEALTCVNADPVQRAHIGAIARALALIGDLFGRRQ